MIRLTPQTGIVLALQAAVLTVLLDRPINLLLLAAVAGAYWIAGGGLRYWRIVALLLALGTWGLLVTQGLFYGGDPRTVWVTLLGPEAFPLGVPPGMYLYREGLWHGLVQSLRFDTVLLMGAALLARHDIDELAGGMRALRLPAPLAFLFTLALRFTPVMAAEARAVWVAQRLRGLRVFTGNPLRWPAQTALAVRAWLLPLLAGMVRRADEVAAALISRGWSPHHATPPAATPPGERVLWAGGFAALVPLAAAQVLTRLYQAGLLYRDWLDWVYFVTANYV